MLPHNAAFSVCSRCGGLHNRSTNSLCPPDLNLYHIERKLRMQFGRNEESYQAALKAAKERQNRNFNRYCDICREKLRGTKRLEVEIGQVAFSVCPYCDATIRRIQMMPQEDQQILLTILQLTATSFKPVDAKTYLEMSHEEQDAYNDAAYKWRTTQKELKEARDKRNGD